MRSFQRRARWFGFVLAAGALSSCGGQEHQPDPVIRPVRYERVEAAVVGLTKTFSGIARAGVESQLSFKVSGNLTRVSVVVGQAVRKGAPIAELDPRDFELQEQNAQANLKNMIAQAKNAQANYERVRGLYENKNASLSDLEASEAAADSAKAGVISGEKQLEIAQLKLSYTRLVAPSAGAILDVRVEVNENVREGDPIAVLASGDTQEVSVAVPEQLIARVRHGQNAIVSFDAVPDQTFEGVVTEVGIAPTDVATTFPVTVELQKVSQRVRPGMSAEVRFTFASERPGRRYLVPLSAVSEDRQGHFLYLVEASEEGFGIVRRQSVRVGDQMIAGEKVEILEGVRDGDAVVTAGISRIEDGMKVRMTGGREAGS